jgi:luciferase family oxidoreductase group 1
MIPLSILDLTPIRQGSTAAAAFHETVDLAQRAEKWGYHRYWLVEHHNTPGVAGAATSVLIAHVAAATRTIRVGAGGIMLPNHAPLKVAEQFGTLAALHPGRIDLGLGRGIHSDPATLRALRRLPGAMDAFPQDVQELLDYFHPPHPLPVHAIPGEGADVPVWILGSSVSGANLAASLGLPFAFAAHFAPDQLDMAIAAYRGRFVPSDRCAAPHLMLSLTVVAAATDAEAELLFSSALQASGGPLPPPVPGYLDSLSPQRAQIIRNAFRHAAVGGPETVARHLADFIARYEPDEVIAVGQIFDPAARRKSFEILSRVHSPAHERPAIAEINPK